MLRVLMRPRWLLAVLLVGLASAGCVRLGLWQWHRHEWRTAESSRIERNYDAPATPFDAVVEDRLAALEPNQAWRQVTLRGTYSGDTILVRGRTERGVLGFEVLEPLETASGTVIINRGHVAQPPDGVSLPSAPPPPTGDVLVTGWLRPSESARQDPLPQMQLASISLEQVSDVLRREVAGTYVRMHDEQPGATSRPTALAPPDTGQGPHLAYALQWWLGALALPAMALALASRQARDERLALTPGDSGRTGAAPPPKRRIWDEEDELV